MAPKCGCRERKRSSLPFVANFLMYRQISLHSFSFQFPSEEDAWKRAIGKLLGRARLPRPSRSTGALSRRCASSTLQASGQVRRADGVARARGRGPAWRSDWSPRAGLELSSQTMTESSESEVLGPGAEQPGGQAWLCRRVASGQSEGVIKRLEPAWGRALEEVSAHWDAVYRAMKRAE